MNDYDVISQIAYLGDDFQDSERGLRPVPTELIKLVRAAIQLEMARQMRWPFPNDELLEDLSSKIACLEKRFREELADDAAIQKERSVVQYVERLPGDSLATPVGILPSTVSVDRIAQVRRLPRAIVAFYTAGLVCSLVFAILLTLSSTGTNLIHPFLSLIGFVGGLGWLTTAWTDLLLWKREIIPVCGPGFRKENSIAA